MEINYHLLTIFECNQIQRLTTKTTPPKQQTKTANVKASSYLSIGQYLDFFLGKTAVPPQDEVFGAKQQIKLKGRNANDEAYNDFDLSMQR